ncbi:cupin domain-containing protein [Undibacterium sp. Ren11W]|uniref:cupin domain-containing protein n=1 Tax=Undibacterium sp. Ren11W TaxID=3413045 RepID=UPI003BF147A4
MSQVKLNSNFIVLDALQTATPVPLTPDIYQELDTRFGNFSGCFLVAEYAFSADWPSWEMHPHGDETLYLIAGAASLHLYADGLERQIEFDTPGSFVIIPKGSWHTAKVKASCTMLFITPGEGTVNGPDPRSRNA